MLSHIAARTRGQGRGPPTPEGQIWAWHTHCIRILGDELVAWPRGCSKGSRCRVSSSISTKAGRAHGWWGEGQARPHLLHVLPEPPLKCRRLFPVSGFCILGHKKFL